MNKPFVILGGGLWGSLLAYRLFQLFPEKDFILFEKGKTLGGNHTWSFFGSDITIKDLEWLQPFIGKSWPRYEVSFPRYQRTIETPYHSITSERLHSVVSSFVPGPRLQLNKEISLSEALSIGEFVFDARGIFQSGPAGYQKFVGLDLQLESPHGIKHPMIMDAKIQQKDGFRFFYLLPWNENRILIEDTRYSNDSGLSEDEIISEIHEFIHGKGWRIHKVARKETGVLPLPWTEQTKQSEEKVIDLAGIFHDTTGYSFPQVMKLLSLLEKKKVLSEGVAQSEVKKLRSDLVSNRKFFRLLNLMMFHASSPDERYRMLQYFYTKSPGLIERFYSGQLSNFDRVRFFAGKPPVRITDAMKILVKEIR